MLQSEINCNLISILKQNLVFGLVYYMYLFFQMKPKYKTGKKIQQKCSRHKILIPFKCKASAAPFKVIRLSIWESSSSARIPNALRQLRRMESSKYIFYPIFTVIR